MPVLLVPSRVFKPRPAALQAPDHGRVAVHGAGHQPQRAGRGQAARRRAARRRPAREAVRAAPARRRVTDPPPLTRT